MSKGRAPGGLNLYPSAFKHQTNGGASVVKRNSLVEQKEFRLGIKDLYLILSPAVRWLWDLGQAT